MLTVVSTVRKNTTCDHELWKIVIELSNILTNHFVLIAIAVEKN